MLYSFYDALQRTGCLAHSGFESAEAFLHHSATHPSAFNPALEPVVGYLALLERLTKEYPKPEFGIRSVEVDGKEVAVHEICALNKPFCRLLHFRKEMQGRGPVVLLAAPLSGHHSTLLRKTAQALLPRHDVYITDWVNAREVPMKDGGFDLSTYTAYIAEFLRYLGRQTHVVAVCQPAVPVLAAVSLLAQGQESAQPLSMTLMAGPIDTRVSPTEVDLYAKAHSLQWFESTVIQRVPLLYPGAGRRVYPGFIQQMGFVAMNLDRHQHSYIEYANAVMRGNEDAAKAHKAFYDEYNAVMDMPAEFYLETLQKVFMDHDLPRGQLELCGQHIEPASITMTGLLTVEGEKDDITGIGQTKAAHELLSAAPAHDHVLVEGVGHYGVFAGRKFQERILPRIEQFIAQTATSRGPV